MTDKDKIRNIIELFIAWNGETDVIDIANIDSAVDFINDSLEVKEVDLEKEISEYFVEHPDEFFSDKYKIIAKHFFELGLNASNPLTWEDMFTIFRLVNEVLDDYAEGKTKKEVGEEVLKRFKVQKREKV